MFDYAGNIKRSNHKRTKKTPMVMGSEIFATIVLPFPMFSSRWVEVSVFNLTFINVMIWGHVLSTVSQITKSLNRFHCHLRFIKGCLNFLAHHFPIDHLKKKKDWSHLDSEHLKNCKTHRMWTCSEQSNWSPKEKRMITFEIGTFH